MKLVVIESPYAGDVSRNLRYLDAALADCFARGEAPFASHGLYTREGVLDDRVPDERARGIRAGFAWGYHADLVAVYEDLGVTPGMLAGIERAEKRGQTVERRRIPGWDRTVAPTDAVICPGALVEIVSREAMPAVLIDVPPAVGDRGRVVRIVHLRVEGEPMEGVFDPTIAHVLLEGQERVIGFSPSCLRVVSPGESDG